MINVFQDYTLFENGDSSMLAFQRLFYFHTTSFFATSLMKGQKNYQSSTEPGFAIRTIASIGFVVGIKLLSLPLKCHLLNFQ